MRLVLFRLSNRASSTWSKEFGSQNAYQVLGLPRDCTNAAIKKAFQELAKATHPDLQGQEKCCSSSFIRVLAAYQILSDPQKRTLYDQELFAHEEQATWRRPSSHKSSEGSYRAAETGHGRSRSTWSNPEYILHDDPDEDMDVVEWLRHYRTRVSRIARQKEIGKTKGGVYESLHSEYRAAIRNIYYGPGPGALKGFPDVFEAEERSSPLTKDILQLVYGRFLFATVSYASDNRKRIHGEQTGDQKLWDMVDKAAYRRIELRLNGELKAHASRRPVYVGELNDRLYMIDSISVYLQPEDDRNPESSGKLLGIIQGLSATEAGMKCLVLDADGRTTHAILQHRTLMVNNLYWYRIVSGGMQCDCRCRRPWFLPSRFWLFKPRCSTHDIGGWYIETFKRTRTRTSLHPAMYILATAYKTLDKEAAMQKQPKPLTVRARDAATRFWTSKFWTSFSRQWG